MTRRIADRFAALAREGRAGLIPFVMTGDPDPATSLAIVMALPQAGRSGGRNDRHQVRLRVIPCHCEE